MKKILLAGTALAGVALLTSPAHAQLKLDLGGYFRGYGVWADNDEEAGDSIREFDFLRDSEVHFTGEFTTDMGLTVGAHTELKIGNEADDGNAFVDLLGNPNGSDGTMTDEAYAYFSGQWGRVNLGAEDGAAYLLQVAAPSADANVDGLRVYIEGFNSGVWEDGDGDPFSHPGPFNANLDITLGYDHADFRQAERLTYLTPKWNGFQAGVSYAAEPYMQNPFAGNWGMNSDDDTGEFEDLWEASARWDGEFNGFGISFGAGYSRASPEVDNGAGSFGSDDLTTWNTGLNLSWQGWSLGGAYKNSDTGVSGSGLGEDDTIWVVGGAWDNGPWHAGLSYYDREIEEGAYGNLGGTTGDLQLTRWTAGGGYTFGPGMTFRGSLAMLEVDEGGNDPDQWQFAVGTDLNF
jgi:outer membrane protein OmpU